MEENVLSAIGGIGMYGVISICIFFAFFTGMLAWAFFLKKSHVQTMRELPLVDAESRNRETNLFDHHQDL